MRDRETKDAAIQIASLTYTYGSVTAGIAFAHELVRAGWDIETAFPNHSTLVIQARRMAP